MGPDSGGSNGCEGGDVVYWMLGENYSVGDDDELEVMMMISRK